MQTSLQRETYGGTFTSSSQHPTPQFSTILSSSSPKDILHMHLQLTLFKTPIDLSKLLYIAEECHFEPAYFHVASEMEKLGRIKEARRWYQKTSNPHAYFKLAKILMEEYEMDELMGENEKRSSLTDNTQRNVQISITGVNGEEQEKDTAQSANRHAPTTKSSQHFSKRQRRFVRLLKKAAAHGHEEALYELGVLYSNINWIKSFEYLRTSVQAGWALALMELSKERDPVVMQRLEEDVIENIHISEKEQFKYLGFAYQYGYGRKQDVQEAMKMFRQAWQYEQNALQEPKNARIARLPLQERRNLLSTSRSTHSSTQSLNRNIPSSASTTSRKRKAFVSTVQDASTLPQRFNPFQPPPPSSSVSQKQIHSLLSLPEIIDEVKYILKRYHDHQNSVLQRRLEKEEQSAAAANKKKRHVEKQPSLTEIYSSPEFIQIRANIRRKVGVPWSKELGRAKNLLKMLIAEGHRESTYLMAEMYSKKYQGVERNIVLATQLYKASAYSGHVESMFKYANNLINEFEWTENPMLLTEAVLYYKKAAEQGHASSMVNLAVLYERGLVNGRLDYQRAANLYHEAVKLGDAAGANGLAALYMYGNGVPRNYMKTAKYLFEAIDNGDEDAKENMQTLCSDPQGLVAMNLALEAFRHLANEGDREARRYELRLQAELGYKQHWKSNDPALVDIQMHMEHLHFENHGKGVEQDGFTYYTVTYQSKLYLLKSFVIPANDRTQESLIWTAFKKEISPLIHFRHQNLHPVLHWAADMDNVYLMSEKIDIDFQYLLMRSRWDYVHDLSMEIPHEDLFSNTSLIGLTIAPRGPAIGDASSTSAHTQSYFTTEFVVKSPTGKDSKECVYDSDQKLLDIIQIAKIVHEYHSLTNASHRSVMSRNFLLKTSKRLERLYLSKVFSRSEDTIGVDKEEILLTNFGLEHTTKSLGYEPSSYSWSAPEVIRDGKYSKASDVFSFGMLLFEFLTHTMPFGENSNQYTVRNKILRGDIPEIPIEIQQYKSTNFFVAHIISIMIDCWSDSRSRPTMEEIIKRLHIIKTRIAVHRSRVSLQPLFLELKIEQYLDRFAQQELLLEDLKTMDEDKIKALFNQQMAPCSRLLQWRILQTERSYSPRSIFRKLLVKKSAGGAQQPSEDSARSDDVTSKDDDE